MNQSPVAVKKPNQHDEQHKSTNSSDDSSALKVAESRSIRGKTPREMCRISRIRVSSPIVERSSEDGRRLAVISRVRPPKEKRLRLELDRVEVGALTPLERRPPSSSISGLRARRAATLESDADDLEDQAREVDAIRRRKRYILKKEDILREESHRLRSEASRLRHLIISLTRD